MNRKNLKIFATAVALILLAVAAIIFAVPPKTVSAQTGPIFTMAPAYNGFSVPAGVVILDQSTGAVNFCPTQALAASNNTTSNGTCQLRGRAIPGSGTSGLSITGANGSVFILNNESGMLLECTTFGKIGCISYGYVPR